MSIDPPTLRVEGLVSGRSDFGERFHLGAGPVMVPAHPSSRNAAGGRAPRHHATRQWVVANAMQNAG
jgi:hypothetical protein